MNDLGSMLLNGLGCEVDRAEALKWYQAAAESGHPVACYNLGKRYLHDVVDLKRAFRWFSEAASQNYPEAVCELGTMYRFGHGTERDLLAAADFHVIAAKQGDVVAMGNISDYLDELQGIALSGNPTASRCMSDIYNFGLGAEKSVPLTWAWAKWAKDGCTPSDDADEADRIEWAYEFYKSHLAAEDRKQGERVLKSLIAAMGKASEARKSPAKHRRRKK
jgi:TPR repeat protein